MRYLFLLIGLFFSAIASAQTVTRGPYLQNASSTSITIRWRTSTATTSRVLIGTSVHSLTTAVQDSSAVTEHELQVTGLSPWKKYYYAVGDLSATFAGGSSSYSFKTSPTTGRAVATRIWVVGDPGVSGPSGASAAEIANQAAVRNAFQTFSSSRPPNLWLMLGDNAYNSGTDSEYQRGVFDVYESTLKTTPLWPTLGNHDNVTSPAPYYSIFTLPTSGEAGGLASGTEHYYSFDYGNIHFISLNSEDVTSVVSPVDHPMLTWLTQDLAATNQTWVVAFWHHPPYSEGSHRSDSPTDSSGRMTWMRENVLPVLEQAGVDLVLTGHSHGYERSKLVDGHYGLSSTYVAASMEKDSGDGSITGDGTYSKLTEKKGAREGAVYVVAGSSGQIDGSSPGMHPVTLIALRELGSLVLDINGPRLNAKFLNSAGNVSDDFSIIKGSPGPRVVSAIRKTRSIEVTLEKISKTPAKYIAQLLAKGKTRTFKTSKAHFSVRTGNIRYRKIRCRLNNGTGGSYGPWATVR